MVDNGSDVVLDCDIFFEKQVCDPQCKGCSKTSDNCTLCADGYENPPLCTKRPPAKTCGEQCDECDGKLCKTCKSEFGKAPSCRPSCVDLFSECNFEGEHLRICEDDPDLGD